MGIINIALAGNPNSGKTSIFNYLTGAHQKVGNYGGVTVDIKEGSLKIEGETIGLVDLPGTYSLSAYSLEEKVARDYIVNEKPDVVINVIDSSNLERNLYLSVQLHELGIKPIFAFNMWDEVKSKGLKIDLKQLEKLLGGPIITTIGKNGTGVKELIKKAIEQVTIRNTTKKNLIPNYPEELQDGIDKLSSELSQLSIKKYPLDWLSIKLLENDTQIEEFVFEFANGKKVVEKRDKIVLEIEKLLGDDPETLIAESRYGLIAGAIRETVELKKTDRVELSDKIDKVLTHPVLAYPVFLIFLFVLFQVTFVLGAYPMGWIEALFGLLGDLASTYLPEGNLKDLIVDGVIAGVGGVIVFLPNVLILFLGVSIMEDTGYMARAAFIMDKLMHKIGLHGKSFVPVIMGLGCNVPAIMATRTLESRSDRIKTILLAPLISCSARLPVYVLFIGALFPKNPAIMLFLFQWVFGFLAFMMVGILFKHTILPSDDYPFVMELPPYRIPTFRSVLIHMWQKGKHYLDKMGKVVLVFSIILWAGSVFPRSPHIATAYDQKIEIVKENNSYSEEQKKEKISELTNNKGAEIVANTYIGRIGKFLEPATRPFGCDWRGAVSLLTGFVAKEVVVGSMGVLYNLGQEEGEDSKALQKKITENFTPLAGFAFMLFVLLYTPCIVALITIVRELRSWKWSVFSVGYQLVLAWVVAVIVFQVGTWIGLG